MECEDDCILHISKSEGLLLANLTSLYTHTSQIKAEAQLDFEASS